MRKRTPQQTKLERIRAAAQKRKKPRKAVGVGQRTASEQQKERAQALRAKYGVKFSIRRRKLIISAPQILSIDRNFLETTKFICAVRAAYECGFNSVRVSLKDVEEISPLCITFLAAELDRVSYIRSGKHSVDKAIKKKKKPDLTKLFGATGVFDLLHVDGLQTQGPDIGDEKYIKLRTGQLVDMQTAIAQLSGQVKLIDEFMDSNPKLFGAVNEAITNVRWWAYKDFEEVAAFPKLQDRWWFLASYNTVKKRFSLFVYDSGQGIPATLRRFGWEDFKSTVPVLKFDDSDAIEAAFRKPRSKTGLSHRGKGLPEMRNLLEQFTKGSLRVISGRGYYSYDCDGNVVKKLLPHDIGGTMVAWEIYDTSGKR